MKHGVYAIYVEHCCLVGGGSCDAVVDVLTFTGGSLPVAVATKDSISLDTKLKTFDRSPEDEACGGSTLFEAIVSG